jgi:DNA-binding transcriptional ArsR family regulator
MGAVGNHLRVLLDAGAVLRRRAGRGRWLWPDKGQEDVVDDLDQGFVWHGRLVHDQVVADEVNR